MARKFEFGLKYFPHDSDMAYDRNIRKLTKEYGVVGYGIFTRILECIYRNGHYITYSDEFVFDVLDSINMDLGDEQKIRDVITYCANIGLFDNGMFSFYNVLTSHGIQERYFFAKEQSIIRAIKTNTLPEYEYLLIDLKTIFGKHMKSNEPTLSVDEIPFENDSVEVTERPYVPMMIIEEPVEKPKTMKDKQSDMAERDNAFRESLKPYLEQYGRDMLNEFYLYWSEPNKSKTKMRFEQQPTWDLSRRLAKWSRNNYSNKVYATNKPNGTATLIGELAAISASRRQSEGAGIIERMPEGD